MFVNRILPLEVEGGSSGVGLGYVSHGFAKHPLVANLGYGVLVGGGELACGRGCGEVAEVERRVCHGGRGLWAAEEEAEGVGGECGCGVGGGGVDVGGLGGGGTGRVGEWVGG